MNKIGKNSKWIVFCLLVLTLMVNLHSEETELGPCEVAFFLCMQDPLWTGATTEGLIHCAIGYAFCKKYIDSVKDY